MNYSAFYFLTKNRYKTCYSLNHQDAASDFNSTGLTGLTGLTPLSFQIVGLNFNPACLFTG